MLQPIDSALAVEAALSELSDLLAVTQARIRHEELPIVQGRAELLTTLFSTLLRHQIGEPGPDAMLRGSITARFDAGTWRFTVETRDVAGSGTLGGSPEDPGVTALCRRILDRHGGRLEALSRDANAHCAIFRLPAAPRQGQRREAIG